MLDPAGQAPARHHVAVAEALSDVAEGATRRLMLMLPPGSAKSTYASLLFPAWWFVRHPRSSVLAISHTEQLATHFGRGVRGLVREHGRRLGYVLRDDARAANRLATDLGGEYFATGVRGAVTGRRADLAVIDDPVRSLADAESFMRREALWDWYRSDLVTRLKPGARVVLVMTRWHVDDLCGRLLESGELWRVLSLPALALEGDLLGRTPGEALWPEWETTEAIEAKRAILGERRFSALFQQVPLRAEGRLFDPRTIGVCEACPAGRAVRAWDLAASRGGDWTVGLKLVRDENGLFCVADIRRLRAGPAEVMEEHRRTAEFDGTEVQIALPQDPGQAGKHQAQSLTRMLAGFRVLASPETGTKAVRATPVAAQAGVGNLRLVQAPWNACFLDELSVFPDGEKDDQVDALSRAFMALTEMGSAARFMKVNLTGR